ncbi:fimbrial-like protein [Scandinavium sp. NPDC088450]|uniref:fimbrial-like protein n=1 Tax=Scandinavium sp. NPDC088450 TaxID=3364514 RepID=UPI00384DA4C3
MFNKTLLAVATATLLSSAVFSASAADEGHGKISFEGIVISAPCSIAPGDEDQTINLGEVADTALNGDKYSLPVDVNIHLQDCTLGTISKVDVTFTSANADATTNLLKNTSEGNYGGATDVGVRLLTEGNENVVMGAPQEITLAPDSSYQVLSFKARMESPENTATPGNVTTDVNYVLAYN